MRDKTIDYVLRAAWIAVAKMYNEEAGKKGSTMATGFVLLNIDPEHGTPSTSLGPKMGMEATSLSRTLKTMEEKDLIERKPNPEDGRSILICLTDFGVKMREYSKEVVLTFDQKVRENISENDLKTFIEVANTIIDMISNRKIFNQTKTIST
ncbi:MarR family winged helix-turn-helix transcriptional regulator [Mesohalobacter halotolerans]|uniref:MarR family transcriptional regulator n=1 Tax=Mesohalobacter halotolerans TaxID=1883405 RepID=A0A4V6ALC4_9FLAO|nr:MarR family transcriptional regulator [Mesohalobacter halotolerans]MBS3738085.1 MarR family transcriptional regulator [Psychroflexus sp.]TKS56115.1 MarR family transcriptional regulator [Mesohalobacter halotolerans]